MNVLLVLCNLIWPRLYYLPRGFSCNNEAMKKKREIQVFTGSKLKKNLYFWRRFLLPMIIWITGVESKVPFVHIFKVAFHAYFKLG